MDTLMPILIAGGMLAVVGLTAMGVGIAVGLLDEWRLRRDENEDDRQ